MTTLPGKTVAALIPLIAAALFGATPAGAEDQRILKSTTPLPASHWHYTESLKYFQDAVTKATGGKIQFQSYFSSQLGDSSTAILGSGLADLADVLPSYEPAKLPLSTVSELPGLYTTSCQATTKLWNIVKDGGLLSETEYKPLGIKVLYVLVHAPYKLLSANKKITSLQDVSGLKIRATGAAMDMTVRALGGVPVRVTGTEMYDALSRGTVDAVLFPIGTVRIVNLEKLLHYSVEGPSLSSGSFVVAIRQKTWDSLSPDVQVAMTKAAADTQQHLCNFVDNGDKEDTAWLVKETKLDISNLSPRETAQWTRRLAPVPEAWAKEMDSTNRPGSAVLKAFKVAPGN